MIAHRITGSVQGGARALELAFEFGDSVDRQDPIAVRPVELTGDDASIVHFRHLAHDAHESGGAELWHPLGAPAVLAFESLNFCEAVLSLFVRETGLPWRFEIKTGLPEPEPLEPDAVY